MNTQSNQGSAPLAGEQAAGTIAPERPPLGEMPILFQLIDVSRPRAPRSPILPPPTVSTAEPRVEKAPPSSDTRFTPPPIDPGDSLAAMTTVDIDGLSPSLGEASLLASTTLGEQTDSSLIGETETITSEPATPAAIADRRQQRARRQAAPQSGDWFQAHGKLLAVGFVVALCATIYVARARRPQQEDTSALQPPEISWSIEHPGDAAAHLKSESHSSPEVAHDPAPHEAAPSPVKPATHPPEPSPAPADAVATHDSAQATPDAATEASPTESQVSLHPPAAAEPSEAVASEGSQDALFPWTRKEGERVAARPEAPATAPPSSYSPNPAMIENPTLSPNAFQPSAAPPTTAPPTAMPPSATPPMSTAPPADAGRSPYLMPNRTFGPESQPAQPAAPRTTPYSPAPPAAAAPSTSSPPAPNGYRYERTGSGLY